MINPEELSEKFWLLAFDLKTSGQDLDQDQLRWLRSMRYQIWEKLRLSLKLVPIQNSLWIIRDVSQLEKVQELANGWVQKYNEHGYQVKIQIFPIATNVEGAETFMDWEHQFLMDWLGSVQESIEKARQSRKCTKKQLSDWTRKVELVQEIASADFSGDHLAELQDLAIMVLDALEEVRKYAQ